MPINLKHYFSLKKNRDFQFTYRVGKSVSCRLCTLIYVRDRRKKKESRKAKPEVIPHVRVGFSVSKKVGNSVSRNRVKRRLREAVTPLLPSIKPGYNLIIIARPSVLLEQYQNLCGEVESLLYKAGLLERR